RVCMIFQGKKVVDDSMEHIAVKYGEPRLRVRLSNRDPIPQSLAGVLEQIDRGRCKDLVLSKDANRREILQSLMAAGDVEHFEMVKPSLHDIFVSIAKPSAIETMEGA
ncbi:MAG TPA: DUF4162 domain-containing protein, partial [Pirellula sp.]|nr:DUF4162 domain-containing protein [Pirellula sp.]